MKDVFSRAVEIEDPVPIPEEKPKEIKPRQELIDELNDQTIEPEGPPVEVDTKPMETVITEDVGTVRKFTDKVGITSEGSYKGFFLGMAVLGAVLWGIKFYNKKFS